MSASVVAVSVGLVRPVDWDAGSLPVTAIEKHNVTGPIRIGFDGVAGNECADVENHHLPHMRVYAYAEEDYRFWEAELGASIAPGMFGEQLTTRGIDLNTALMGERWRVGTALLEISHVRIPCQTFKGWMGESGYDETVWVKRFTRAGRPGPYFRVLDEGEVGPGDPIVVEHKPDHDLSVADLFLAVTIRPDLLPRIPGVPGLPDWVYEKAAGR